MFRRRGNRTKPLLDIFGEWLTGNQYPDVVSILMRNGHVVRYAIDSHAVRIHTGKGGWEKGLVDVVGYKSRTEKSPRKRDGFRRP